MEVAPYAILYLVPAMLSAALAVYGWRRRHYRVGMPFSALMAALAFWSFCHALSVASPTLEGTLFWSQIQYGGIAFIGPLWLLFALDYSNQSERVTPIVRRLLFVPSVIIYILVLTNNWHHLWWTTVAIDTSRPFVSLAIERGIPFWIHTAYSYGCLLFGVGLFIYTMIESPLTSKRQSQLMVIGALIPIVGNIAHLMGIQTIAVDDPTPFLLLGSGIVSWFATLRYQLLDLAPIAQREVFESMPDGLIVINHKGDVNSMNEPAQRLLAMSTHLWNGRRFVDIIEDSPIATGLRSALALPPGNISRSVNYNYTTEDGLHGVEIRLQPLRARYGPPAGALIVLRDTTERVRMLQTIDQRLTELSLINRIARAANAAVYTEDLLRMIARETIQAMDWDRVAIGMLQADNANLHIIVDQIRTDQETIEGTEIDFTSFELIEEALHAGQVSVLDSADPRLSQTSTGDVIQHLGLRTVLAIPLYSQSQPLGMMFVGNTSLQTDQITPEMIHLSETIGELITEAIVHTRLYEEAQTANRLKSTFLATVSHDLRTPLTSIVGYTDMLQRGFYGPMPERANDAIKYLQHNSRVLLRLITDILDFSKIEAGHLKVDIHPTNLQSAIHNVAGAMRPQIAERGIDLYLEIDDELPLAQANSARVEQVLTNLLSNAVKFTEKGSITIRAATWNDHIRLSVQDTGIGIAPEHQSNVFREFHQVENQQTRRFGGTGLGLAISRRLMELMGGALSLESTPGVGSTFHCDLPIAAVNDLEQIVASDTLV